MWYNDLPQAEPMDLMEDEDEPEESESAPERALFGRRRRKGNQDLPPRARYVNKILIYLNKEMASQLDL